MGLSSCLACVILELKAIQFKILLPRPRHRIMSYLSSACAIPFRTAFVCTVPSWAFESSYHGVVMAEQYSIALSAVRPTVNCFKSVWSTTSSVVLVIGDLRVTPALTAQQFSSSITMMAGLQFEGRLGIPPLLGLHMPVRFLASIPRITDMQFPFWNYH